MSSKLWLILLAAIIGCSKADIPLTPEEPTLLKIIAVDEDGVIVDSADVFINGSEVGKTPFNSQDVQPGLHTLRVSRNGFKVYSERVVVEKGEFYTIEAFLEKLPPDMGQLFVTSNLDSTIISIKDENNNIVSESTEKTLAIELSPGKYIVTGEKTGSPKVEQEAEIFPKNSTIINLELTPPNNSTPPTLQFVIQEDTVKLGQPVNLNWSTNGHQVIIDQSIGVRGPNGSEKHICQTAGLKVFTATAYNNDNLTTGFKDSVYILPADGKLPTLQFGIAQDSVVLGESISLNWATDGQSVIIDQGIGTRGPSGSESIQSSTTGMHIFTATAFSSENLAVQKKDSVYVKSAATPPTLDFSIEQDSVVVGESYSLNWASNGVQVIIDQSVGTRGPNGSEQIFSNATGLLVFTATAYSSENLTMQKKDSIYVKSQAIPPTLEFDVLEDSVEFGEPVFIQWQTNGFQVVIDQGVGLRGPFGTDEINFANPGKKVFTATAYGEGNLLTSKKDSIYVKEALLPPNPIMMLSASRKVTVNEVATISWQSQNADYIVVDYVTNPDRSSTQEVTFSTPGFRIVTATAFNQSGYTSASDTIEVVIPQVESVDDILVAANVVVRADQGEAGYISMNAASFEIKTAGKYKISAEVWYDSGDSQRNESYYIDVTGSFGASVLPQDSNAGVYKVIEDEAGTPHTSSKASGIFNLAEGTQSINVTHYAKIAGIYSGFLNGEITGPESVKILGFKVSYVGE